MTINELIERLNNVRDKDKEIDISINVQHGEKPDITMIDQFSVVIK
ncbi:hypothetical protein [Lysinibacillus odysseyi]|nr:hypothetical protein [Lysinibacillus odysseyi]